MAAFKACFFLDKYPFTKADLQWLPPYSLGDTLFFSDGATTDTGIIDFVSFHQPRNRFELDWEGHNVFEISTEYEASAFYEVLVEHGEDSLSMALIYERCDTSFWVRSWIVKVNRGGYGFKFHVIDNIYTLKKYPHITLKEWTTQKINYHGSLHDGVVLNDTDTTNSVPVQVEIVKGVGIVSYTFPNGNTFHLDSIRTNQESGLPTEQ